MKKVNAYKNVKKYIRDSGMKQKYVAEKLGLSEVEMCLMLNGKRTLTADSLVNLAVALETDVNSILDYKELKKRL